MYGGTALTHVVSTVRLLRPYTCASCAHVHAQVALRVRLVVRVRVRARVRLLAPARLRLQHCTTRDELQCTKMSCNAMFNVIRMASSM